jgi:hypothetical protein
MVVSGQSVEGVLGDVSAVGAGSSTDVQRTTDADGFREHIKDKDISELLRLYKNPPSLLGNSSGDEAKSILKDEIIDRLDGFSEERLREIRTVAVDEPGEEDWLVHEIDQRLQLQGSGSTDEINETQEEQGEGEGEEDAEEGPISIALSSGYSLGDFIDIRDRSITGPPEEWPTWFAGTHEDQLFLPGPTIINNLRELTVQLGQISALFGGARVNVRAGDSGLNQGGLRFTTNDRGSAHSTKPHNRGLAADINVDGVDTITTAQTLLEAMDSGRLTPGGLEARPAYVHYDTRGEATRINHRSQRGSFLTRWNEIWTAHRQRQREADSTPTPSGPTGSIRRTGAAVMNSTARREDNGIQPAQHEPPSPDSSPTEERQEPVERTEDTSGNMDNGGPGLQEEQSTKQTEQPTITSETLLQAPGGTPSTRRVIGVGENVEFTSTISGDWTASAGDPTQSSTKSTRFLWIAPSAPGSCTVTLAANGQSANVVMSVIAPSGLVGTKFRDLPIPAGSQGAGMEIDLTITPLTVSFGFVEMKELAGPATNVTGYFEQFPEADLNHNPNPDNIQPDFHAFDENNSGLRDRAADMGEPSPWSAGTFDWLIPNVYRVQGEGSAGTFFYTSTQSIVMEGPPQAGQTTVTKLGATAGPRSPSGDTPSSTP